jgi:hypothetical protein
MQHNKGRMEGHDALSFWFGLSYASFLTLPRVLMEAMSDEWQGKMAALLNEYDDTFDRLPSYGTRVQVLKNGKMTKTPEWLINYRRPDPEVIESFKRK